MSSPPLNSTSNSPPMTNALRFPLQVRSSFCGGVASLESSSYDSRQVDRDDLYVETSSSLVQNPAAQEGLFAIGDSTSRCVWSWNRNHLLEGCCCSADRFVHNLTEGKYFWSGPESTKPMYPIHKFSWPRMSPESSAGATHLRKYCPLRRSEGRTSSSAWSTRPSLILLEGTNVWARRGISSVACVLAEPHFAQRRTHNRRCSLLERSSSLVW